MLRSFLLAAAASIALAGAAHAQQPQAATAGASNIKRTLLQKFEIPNGSGETVVGLAEIVPNANIGRHTHFGIEAGYVVEGEVTLMVAGQPDKVMKVGDSWQIPVGAVHDAKSGANGAKVIVTYVVEKGKPLATPAP